MKGMKVIFLDIDGVLNSERLIDRRISEGFEYDNDPECYHNIDEIEVERLAKFCEEYGINIVLSSSWRCWTLEETIKDLSKPLYRYIHPIIKYLVGVTPRSLDRKDRGDEIKAYLDEHSEICNYIIIDDDSDMLDEQLNNFLQVDFRVGLQESDYPRIKQILKIDI